MSIELIAHNPLGFGWGQRGNLRIPMFSSQGEGRTCRWCVAKLTGRRTSWCSQKCVDAYMLRSHWPMLRKFIMERDKNCQICGHYSWERGNPHPYWWGTADVDSWPSAGLVCTLNYDWDVDHIIAVADGGTDDPANLRLLCGRCHREVTASQHREWARQRRSEARA